MSEIINTFLQISCEFDLIVNVENSFNTFMENWDHWKPAILGYSQAYNNMPRILQGILKDFVSGDAGTCVQSCLYKAFLLISTNWCLLDSACIRYWQYKYILIFQTSFDRAYHNLVSILLQKYVGKELFYQY